MTDTTALFTPHAFAGLELSNRLVLAPMTRTSAQDDGQVHFDMVDYYRDFARGNFSLLITEGIYTDEAFSQGYANQPGLANQAQQDSWRPVVDAVHQQGGRIIAQLMHAGAQTQHNRFKDEVVAPSESRASGEMLSFYGGSGPFPLARETPPNSFPGYVKRRPAKVYEKSDIAVWLVRQTPNPRRRGINSGSLQD